VIPTQPQRPTERRLPMVRSEVLFLLITLALLILFAGPSVAN
jgi:hypothetical protein